jgi:phosphopantothenate synthetase
MAIVLHTEATKAGNYPQFRFNQRERKLLKTVDDAIAGKVIVAAAQATSVGGAAAEDFTVSGMLATDVCIVTLNDNGTNNVTVTQAKPASGKITVTFSADPGADAVISYIVMR